MGPCHATSWQQQPRGTHAGCPPRSRFRRCRNCHCRSRRSQTKPPTPPLPPRPLPTSAPRSQEMTLATGSLAQGQRPSPRAQRPAGVWGVVVRGNRSPTVLPRETEGTDLGDEPGEEGNGPRTSPNSFPGLLSLFPSSSRYALSSSPPSNIPYPASSAASHPAASIASDSARSPSLSKSFRAEPPPRKGRTSKRTGSQSLR